MSTKIHIVQQITSSRRILMAAGFILLSAILIAIYIEIMTAQIIAPPGVRVLEFFWRAFSWLKG